MNFMFQRVKKVITTGVFGAQELLADVAEIQAFSFPSGKKKINNHRTGTVKMSSNYYKNMQADLH
jgi:hypothetical protein